MDSVDINPLAVVVGAAITMALGGLWYSPVGFGGAWERSFDVPPEAVRARVEATGKTPFLIGTVAALVLAAVLAVLVSYAEADNIAEGAFVGLLASVGLVATATFTSGAFSGRKMTQSAIDTAYFVVASVVNGGLFGLWG